MGFGLHSFQEHSLSVLKWALLSTAACNECRGKGLGLHPPLKSDSAPRHEERIIGWNPAFVPTGRRQSPCSYSLSLFLMILLPITSYIGDSQDSLATLTCTENKIAGSRGVKASHGTVFSKRRGRTSLKRLVNPSNYFPLFNRSTQCLIIIHRMFE